MRTVRFGDSEHTDWLYRRLKSDEERIETLEDRVDELSGTLDNITRSVIGLEGMVWQYVHEKRLHGYANGEGE